MSTRHENATKGEELKGWVWLLLGFLAGAVTSGLILLFFFLPLRFSAPASPAPVAAPTSPTSLSPMNSRAYLDQSACPKSTLPMHVGTWEGVGRLANGGRSRWRNARNADGRFEIKFLGEDGSPLWVERGYWAISGCLYASLITEVDGEPVLYQEVYRVHEISRDHLVYSNYRTGNTFEQHRVGSGED